MNTGWTTATSLEQFSCLCCPEPHIMLHTDPASLTLNHRIGHVGPLSVGELQVGSQLALDCGTQCTAYRVNVLVSGHMETVSGRSAVSAQAGTVLVYPPEGRATGRWSAGSRMLAVKIDRTVVDNALGDVLGRRVTSQVDFLPTMSVRTASAKSWIRMLTILAQQAFQPDSVLTVPLVGRPFVESVARGLLIAADHPHREAVAAPTPPVPSRIVRTAMEIIEAEAHLPLTVSALASRRHASVRGLQAGFRRHLGTSPMAYLREVRLLRAHEALQRSDPTSATVASIAYQWGFTNLGRSAATHAARYGESPASTLRGRR
ncbi:hypothetical protein CQY20_10530 [Mycolicibacterium agri]|uniref:HTH araC/xylS-type domain-containing protein n=1 Tax=Mycolicibacterium agri TaxID=36811 RepID=A0A2A7N7A2_MYCAG|nr:AraC family transcriptional regulator [Mycolicibacterium agri]PEG39318.1 hypothetical protein CQY20_10530 [Mycolicibacterium agri]GFG51697.1 hypothetical protein MAGR_31380 [Mycolicibacterium agri]